MDRRALTLIVAASLALGTPAIARAASSNADALLAQSNTGTLTADGIAAGKDTGTLSSDPKAAAKGSSSTSSSNSGAVADQLPFTGSDPRITLLLGAAAILAGAGIRLRTRNVNDF